MRLERRKILDVEGGTPPECMRILRHEAGHVVQHAYRAAAAAAAGSSCSAAPRHAIRATTGPTRAASNYVQHLRLWYAQSHPDEDFAETFAVWLTPALELAQALCRLAGAEEARICRRADGRDRRREAGADAAALQVDPLEPAQPDARRALRAEAGASTLVDAAATYDRDLRRIFSDDPRHRRAPAASTFLRQQPRRDPADRVALDRRVPADARHRARRHDRPLPRAESARRRAPSEQLRMDFTVLLTAKTVHVALQPVAAASGSRYEAPCAFWCSCIRT